MKPRQRSSMIIIMLIEALQFVWVRSSVKMYMLDHAVKILNSKTLFTNVEAENIHEIIPKYVVINVGRFV
jgi:hypothetical protein